MKNRIRSLLATLGIFVLAAAAVTMWRSRARAVGTLTPADYRMITNAVSVRSKYEILEVIPRGDVVVVNAGTNGVCWRCFYLQRARDGWTITWEGS